MALMLRSASVRGRISSTQGQMQPQKATLLPVARPVGQSIREPSSRQLLTVAMAFRGGRGGGRRPSGGNRRGPQSGRNGPGEKREILMNDEIEATEVRVVGEDKESLGVMSLTDALSLADDAGVDLLLVVADASPPVCRLLDYSKWKYEKTKADKDQKKRQREMQVETKELKMRPGTDVHDYQVRVRAARKFIDKGNRVKLTLQFRGREMEFKEIGREMFERFVEDLGGDAVVNIEAAAKMQGRQMNMVISKKEGAPSLVAAASDDGDDVEEVVDDVEEVVDDVEEVVDEEADAEETVETVA